MGKGEDIETIHNGNYGEKRDEARGVGQIGQLAGARRHVLPPCFGPASIFGADL
jgi:hypothetical protein